MTERDLILDAGHNAGLRGMILWMVKPIYVLWRCLKCQVHVE